MMRAAIHHARFVIPAKAGIHLASAPGLALGWTPAFAGVTVKGDDK
jgi:hypothetical protein